MCEVRESPQFRDLSLGLGNPPGAPRYDLGEEVHRFVRIRVEAESAVPDSHGGSQCGDHPLEEHRGFADDVFRVQTQAFGEVLRWF